MIKNCSLVVARRAACGRYLLYATTGVEVAVLTKRLYTGRVFQRFDGLEPATSGRHVSFYSDPEYHSDPEYQLLNFSSYPIKKTHQRIPNTISQSGS